jgi:hypothetical protein
VGVADRVEARNSGVIGGGVSSISDSSRRVVSLVLSMC